MSLPFTMSIAGSVPLLIFLILRIIQGDNFSISLGICILKVSLFFYLVPVQLLYHVIPNSIYYFFKSEEEPLLRSHPFRLSYNDEFIIPVNGYFLWVPRLVAFFLVVWLIGVLIFAFLQIKSYHRLREALHSYASHLNTHNKKESIDVVNVPFTCNPYSTGFAKSYIVISKDLWESNYQRELYRHELCHIKNKDIWMRLLCLGVICIHFYNPMAYLLFFLYHIYSECVCDAYAVENLSPEKRKQYARLLVELTGRENPLQSVLQNRFSGSKFCLKERINFIMKDSSIKKGKKLFTIIIIAFSILSCTTTIWAYHPPKITNWNPQVWIGDKDVELVSPEYSYESQYHSEEDSLNFSLSNTIIVTKDGTCSPITITDISAQASCKHTFQTQDLYEHSLNNNDGCTIKHYNATLCSKCSYVQSKTLVSTISYVECPHNKWHLP